MYSYFRAKGIDVTFSLLRELTGMTRHQCYMTLKKVYDIFPEYKTRDREQIILNRIHDILVHFRLSLAFFENARKILLKLWGLLQGTTDSVVAGTVSVLSLISLNLLSPRVRNICERIGITHSTILFQIKNKLLTSLGISGFTTLTKSKELVVDEVLKKVVGIQIVKSKLRKFQIFE